MLVTFSSTPFLDSVRRETMLRNAHSLWVKRYNSRSPLWGFVAAVTGVGSTSACEICKELGWNPHAPAKDALPQ